MSESEDYKEEFESESQADAEKYSEDFSEEKSPSAVKESVQRSGRQGRKAEEETHGRERETLHPCSILSSAQSNSKLSSVPDSPASAQRLIRLLVRENEAFRRQLKSLNERLNALIDRKLTERARRKSTEEMTLQTQVESAKKQVKTLQAEFSAIAARLEKVESRDYIETLRTTVEEKETVLKKLSKSRKFTKKSQRTCEISIEKEISRMEVSAAPRSLQDVHMENELLRLKIREAEREDDRKYALATEMQDREDRLEETLDRLMAVARNIGAFEGNSRSTQRMLKAKRTLEEQRANGEAADTLLSANLQALRRKEAKLRTDVDNLHRNYRQIAEKLAAKQSIFAGFLLELDALRGKFADSAYEQMREQVYSSIQQQKAAAELEIPPILTKSGPKSRRKSPVEATNRSLGGESAPKPPQLVTVQSLNAMKTAKDWEEVPKRTTARLDKPTLFDNWRENEGSSTEKLKENSGESGKTQQFSLLKPSLFAERRGESPSLKQEVPYESSRQRESKAVDLKRTTNTQPLAENKLLLPALPSSKPSGPMEQTEIQHTNPSAFPISPKPNPQVSEEISLLGDFPSRRHGKKPAVESLPAFSSPTTEAAIKPRNRDHLFAEETADTGEKPLQNFSSIAEFDLSALQGVMRQARERSLLPESDFTEMPGTETAAKLPPVGEKGVAGTEGKRGFVREDSLEVTELGPGTTAKGREQVEERKPSVKKEEILDLDESDVFL